MSIKFACPQCKNTLTVGTNLAGKTGKCPHCGTTIRIPTPKARPAVPAASPSASVSSGFSNALNELTESDFNRHSPFEAVYAPPKVQKLSDDVVRRAASKDGRESGDESNKMPAVLIIYAVLNILQSLSYFALAGVMAIAIGLMGDAAKQMPFQAAGLIVGAVIIGIFGVIIMATGIGLLTKQLWGYMLATASYSFFCFLNLFYILSNLHVRNQWVGSTIGLVIGVLLTSYFFRKPCLNFYRIRDWKLPLLSAGTGVLFGLIVGASMFLLGMFAAPEMVE